MVFGSPKPNSRPKLPPNGQLTLTINLKPDLHLRHQSTDRSAIPTASAMYAPANPPAPMLSQRSSGTVLRPQTNILPHPMAALGLLDHCRQNIFRSAFHRDIFSHFHEIDRLQPFSCDLLRTFFCSTFFISPLGLRVGLRFSLSLRPSSSPCLTRSFLHAPPHTPKAKATLNVRRLRARYSREHKSAMRHFPISVQKTRRAHFSAPYIVILNRLLK